MLWDSNAWRLWTGEEQEQQAKTLFSVPTFFCIPALIFAMPISFPLALPPPEQTGASCTMRHAAARPSLVSLTDADPPLRAGMPFFEVTNVPPMA